MVVGSPDTAFILSAAVVAAGAGFVSSRTRHLPQGHSFAAAAAQLPLLLGLAAANEAAAWWMVAALAALAAVYAVVSLLGAGTAFAILALAAEFSAVGLAGALRAEHDRRVGRRRVRVPGGHVGRSRAHDR